MALERLEEALRDQGVSEIECMGRPFDPHLMNAAGVEETARVLEGTVVEVYRPGYLAGEELFRPAQVKVARSPRRGEDGPTKARAAAAGGGDREGTE